MDTVNYEAKTLFTGYKIGGDPELHVAVPSVKFIRGQHVRVSHKNETMLIKNSDEPIEVREFDHKHKPGTYKMRYYKWLPSDQERLF